MAKSLRGIIVAQYGSQKAAAQALGIHEVTLSMWLRHRPGQLLTKAAQLQQDGIDIAELMDAVQARTNMREQGYTQ